MMLKIMRSKNNSNEYDGAASVDDMTDDDE